MKHSLQATLFLIAIFLLSQFLGLFVIDKYIDHEKTAETGVVTYKELPFDIGRPEVEASSSYIFIMISVLVGTALVFVIMKFGKVSIWKAWFFLSVTLCLAVAFSAFINQWLALAISIVIGLAKVLKPHILIHNFSEIFVYGGLAAIFVPIMNLFSAFMLLLFISIYDAFAVWQSRHMVKLAKFQANSQIFAGIFFPYSKAKEVKKEIRPREANLEQTAILGGGDIGFPLIFAGVVMKDVGLLKSFAIPVVVAIALVILLIKGEKGKFYPAMPFLSIGCAIGYGITLLL